MTAKQIAICTLVTIHGEKVETLIVALGVTQDEIHEALELQSQHDIEEQQ